LPDSTFSIHYEKVRFTRGVDKILKLSNHTFPISDKVIETLQAGMGKDNLLKIKGERSLKAIQGGLWADVVRRK
jgi:hypothetical protein